MLTLYTTALSANGRKPIALCLHLGVKVEIVEVNVYRGEGQSPEFLAVNPLGKIPALVDGDLTLWESNAILQYLAESYGEYRLWSRDPKRRADIARWLFWEAAHWQPAMTGVPGLAMAVGRRLGLPVPEGTVDDVRWEDPTFVRAARFLNEQLGTRAYVAGEALTIADFAVAGMMTYARATEFPFDAYPNIAGWYSRIEGLDAWRGSAVGTWG